MMLAVTRNFHGTCFSLAATISRNTTVVVFLEIAAAKDNWQSEGNDVGNRTGEKGMSNVVANWAQLC